MTKKIIGTTATLIAALAFAGCSSGTAGDDTNGNNPKGTGAVDFNLDLPNGESVSTINLHLSCTGLEQDHVLDVEDGEVVAAFGGLTPGQCTATMAAETPEGTDCAGSETFTIVADQTTPVTVTLICQGVGDDPQGRLSVGAEFEVEECNADRIKKIYAIPANILTGESTTIEVETWSGSVQGPATYSFAAVNDATHTGQGTFSASAACAAESASCRDFTCTGLGAAPGVDPSSGLPVAGVWIEVTVEDDDCYDTEKVWVDCLQASVCGDGATEGTEECDDNNVVDGDGCNSDCELEGCGNGIKEGAEECDGTDGVGANQGCTAACELIDNPFCGDNLVNQASEQCDGSDTPANQTCSAGCLIVPDCGNGIKEGAEECDGTDGVTAPDTCNASCEIEGGAPANVCLDCLVTAAASDPDDPDQIMSGLITNCQANTNCNAVLECITASGCYYPNPWECYCGAGADAELCEGTSFVPTGPCFEEMQAAAGTTVNADVLAFTGGALIPIDYAVTQALACAVPEVCQQ